MYHTGASIIFALYQCHLSGNLVKSSNLYIQKRVARAEMKEFTLIYHKNINFNPIKRAVPKLPEESNASQKGMAMPQYAADVTGRTQFCERQCGRRDIFIH